MRESQKRKLPAGWRWVRLEGVCRDITDGTHHTPQYVPQGIPFLTVKNIRERGFLLDNLKFITAEEHKKLCKRCKPEKGDVLYTKVGTTGIAKVVDLDFEFSIFVSVALLKIDPNIVIAEYLGKILNAPFCKSQAENMTQGAANRNLVIQDLKQIILPLPPDLDNQIAIANELERKMAGVDKMRQAALRQKEAIAAMQGAILREVFPYKEGGKLPEGWRWEMLDNLFTIDKQQIAPSNSLFSTLSFIGLENIESDTRKFIPSKNSEDSGDSTCFLFDDKHVLYGKLRPYLNKVYLPDKKGRCSMELLPLIPQNGYSRNFIASVLQSKIVIDFAVKHSTGERMPRANIDKLKKLEVPVPSKPDDRIAIANELKRKMVEVDRIQQATDRQLEAIEALSGSILREAFDFEEK